jgi:hypothetical protein
MEALFPPDRSRFGLIVLLNRWQARSQPAFLCQIGSGFRQAAGDEIACFSVAEFASAM